jgi:DNA-binding NarL/FixJ family response regulator
MRVLIVDDSAALVQRLRSSLAEVPGLEVVGQADNAGDATRVIREARPDVVILDIRMPGGSGIEVLEGLKKNPLPPLVIMLSNYSYQQYRRKCLASGARFYFDKSNEFHKVAEVLRDLMAAASA